MKGKEQEVHMYIVMCFSYYCRGHRFPDQWSTTLEGESSLVIMFTAGDMQIRISSPLWGQHHGQ